jgi:hypothetical protein
VEGGGGACGSDQRTFTGVESESDCVIVREIAVCKIRLVFRRVDYEVVQGRLLLETGDGVRDRFVSVPVHADGGWLVGLIAS